MLPARERIRAHDEASLGEGPVTSLNYHFSGVAGAGMNPLARLMRARGHRVQGSDRALDQGLMLETAALLRGEGIALVPHDGAAIGAGLDRFVYSTAVEAETPEWQRRRARSRSPCSRAPLSWPSWSMPAVRAWRSAGPAARAR